MSKSSTEKKNKFRLKPWAVVAIVLCVAAVIYCATTAWLTGGAPLNPTRIASLGDFKYQTNVYFVQADNTKIYAVNSDGSQTVNAGYVTSTGAVLVSTNSADNNYVGKMRVEIRQRGKGVAFTRVKITHEWLYTVSGNVSRLQGNLNLPFTVNDADFADKRNGDGYLYNKGAFPTGDNYTQIVTGFDSANFDPSSVNDMGNKVQLSVNVIVDAVQFNRYQQIWGMGITRPWAE